MKMTILALAVATLPLLSQAQTTQGRVVYERKVNMHKRLPPEAEQMKAMIPEFQVSKTELLFNGAQSLYKNLPEEQDQMPTGSMEGGGGRMFMRMGGGGPNDETFRDYENEKMVESRELGPKKYLIEDSLRTMKWKLEQDTMTINGKLCYKATTNMPAPNRGSFRTTTTANGQQVSDSTRNRPQTPPQPMQVVAWYCPDYETQAGPENFFGLPGLIMKVDVDNGFMVTTAQTIGELDKQVVKAPTTGKKITREEYRKMMEQQFQGMRPPGGGGGGQRMMIINQ